jgi:hypothetical protein
MALIYPQSAKLRRKGSGSVDPTGQGFSPERLSHARTIIDEAPLKPPVPGVLHSERAGA